MDQRLSFAINLGFQNAKKRCAEVTISNQLISTVFVYEVSNSIFQTMFNKDYELKVIGVNEKFKKTSGEWLLDCCIVKTENSFIKKIAFALESESNTSKKCFDEDFAKILHVNSDIKLYLNGLNQTTIEGVDIYIEKRLKYIQNILESDKYSNDNFYIGFWPSPKQEKKGFPTFWKSFNKYKHLDVIHLYKYCDGGFERITSHLENNNI